MEAHPTRSASATQLAVLAWMHLLVESGSLPFEQQVGVPATLGKTSDEESHISVRKALVLQNPPQALLKRSL
jgi:hypothetical protein